MKLCKIIKYLCLILVVLIMSFFGYLYISERVVYENNIEYDILDNTDLSEDEEPIDDISNYSYVVIDEKTNKILTARNINKKVSAASTIKIFTVLFALEYLTPETLLRVGEEVYLVGDEYAKANIVPANYRLIDLIKATLISSGADAAIAIAKATVDEIYKTDFGVDKFLDVFKLEINKYIANIFPNTHIVDPVGISFENVTTISDMSVAIEKLRKYPFIDSIVATAYSTITNSNKDVISLVNTNKFLIQDSPYYNRNIVGIKTGTLKDLYNIIVRFVDEKNQLIAMLYGVENDEIRYTGIKNLIDKFIK